MWICLWNIRYKVRSILNIIIAVCRQSHQISATALTFYHVADGLFIQCRLGQTADHQCTIFNQGNRSMFQFTCRICLRVDLADLFHLQAAFHTDGIINATTNKENIFRIDLF